MDELKLDFARMISEQYQKKMAQQNAETAEFEKPFSTVMHGKFKDNRTIIKLNKIVEDQKQRGNLNVGDFNFNLHVIF
jgi:uncharacterized protein YdgA (DUF945 family)